MKIDRNTFFYSAAILAISNICLQVLGFIYRIFLSRLAGAEGLGVYRLVFLVYCIANSVCLSGVTMACSRISAEKKAQGKNFAIVPLTKFSIGCFLSIFSVVAIVILGFHNPIAKWLLGDVRTSKGLLMLLGCLFLTGFENVMKSIFIGTQHVKYTAFSELSEQFLRIFAVVYLLSRFGGQDYGRIAFLIMLGMTISEVFSVSFLSAAYRKIFLRNRPTHVVLPKEEKHQMQNAVLKIALPISTAALFDNIIASASSVILPKRLVVSGMTPSEAVSQLGIISGMALPMILLPVALISSVATVLVPSVSKSMALHRMEDVRQRVLKALSVTGLIGIPATAAIVPLAPALSRLFFAQEIRMDYMALLGLAGVLMYYQMMSGSILNGMGYQKHAVASSVFSEIIQLILTWMLASQPQLRVYGYIFAMIISSFVAFLINLTSICKFADLELKPIRFFGGPIVCGGTVYLWVRFIYYFFLGIVGAQSKAVFISSVSALILYFLLLHVMGIKIYEYLKKIQIPKVKLPLFNFI